MDEITFSSASFLGALSSNVTSSTLYKDKKSIVNSSSSSLSLSQTTLFDFTYSDPKSDNLSNTNSSFFI